MPKLLTTAGPIQEDLFSASPAIGLEGDVILCYSHYMSTDQNDNDAVNGLVDSRRAAAMLGVSANTFKVWASRSESAKTGIASSMPKPVATLNGQVYLADEIEDFGRLIALNARAPRTRERVLGAYFTPDAPAALMAQWVVRRDSDVVLEPSLGDGQFALAINNVAASRGWTKMVLHACELDADTATSAIRIGAVEAERLHIGDFLAAKQLPMVDAVIGNPPYVRVRELNSRLQRNALKAVSEAMGKEMDTSGSVWMPFLAKATTHLKEGGRLAFVLPHDFTYVRYARPLWNFIGRSYGRLRVLRFRERVFPDILQNVLILLAEDKGQTTEQIELIAHNRISDLIKDEVGAGVPISISAISQGERAFQEALLPATTREVLTLLKDGAGPAHLRAKFNIGYVSGNKNFFHPDTHAISQFNLPHRSLNPTVASSRQLSRQALRTSAITPTAFLWNPANRLTKGEQDYVLAGERNGVDMAYKCRIRQPWYRVPGVKAPDLLLTTFSDSPRLHINDGAWAASNSVLGGFIQPGETTESFASSWYTPFTLLSTEMQVHSLGGGVMIAVPREADSVQLLHASGTLRANFRKLDSALRSSDSTAAYTVGSRSIEKAIGKAGLDAIWDGIETLTAWRKAQL